MTTAFVTPAEVAEGLAADVEAVSAAALAMVTAEPPVALSAAVARLLALPDLRDASPALGRQVVSQALLDLLDREVLVLDAERQLTPGTAQ